MLAANSIKWTYSTSWREYWPLWDELKPAHDAILAEAIESFLCSTWVGGDLNLDFIQER